jgi:hypothetical protein
MFELATIAPNLDIKGSRGTGNTSPTFQIRGISGGGGATGERSVGYYVDNVFMAAHDGSRHAPDRRRARRGVARPTGHAVWPQQHRRAQSACSRASPGKTSTPTCASRSAASIARTCKA